jgi:hypothetical protein
VRCAHCDGEFTPKTTRRRFCSSRCRSAAWEQQRVSILRAEAGALRALVTTTLESLWEVKAKLDRYVGG